MNSTKILVYFTYYINLLFLNKFKYNIKILNQGWIHLLYTDIITDSSNITLRTCVGYIAFYPSHSPTGDLLIYPS